MKLLKDNIFTFYSKDKKNKDLVETWGSNIFGLSTKSREDLIDEYGFKKSLVTNYKKAAKLI
jgi:NAD+--asparagine ADP-ribosyltransferase